MDGDGTLAMIYETLQGATSQDPNVMKIAEAKLMDWENQPGFYLAITKFLATFGFDSASRFVAVVSLKNGIERHWRKAPIICLISDSDKIEIKRILESIILLEPVASIAIQLAVIVSKIARLDVPRDWPTILPILMENIRITDPDKQYRALLTTYHVVKILSTKRLSGDRKIFQDMSAEIFDYLCSLWDSLFIGWATSGASGDSLQRAHLALKILRVLAIRGYKIPHENPSVVNFIPLVMRRAKETLELRVSRQDSSVLLGKHVITMWKIVGDLLETHPLSFVPFLQGGLEFATYFGFSEEGRNFVFERVAIYALNLLKGIILCPEFMTPRTVDGLGGKTAEADPLTFEAAKLKGNFFSADTLTILVRVLVTRYLPLTTVELDSWSEDPEEYALRMEESGEMWKYNLRQSAETLFVTLFKEFRKPVEVLLSIMSEFQSPLKDPNDRPTILAKDALYNAAGITAYELYDEFCFDTWMTTTLLEELTLPVPILHRRITWLVGQWTGIKILAESRPRVYALLLSGLRSPDVVVRLSSAQALRSCLDDFDFVPEQFSPFMQDTFLCLFNLLKDVKESDNKMRVLHAMSFLIERMGSQIKTSAQIASLSQYLPLIWGTEHNMLKAAVVSTAIQLVHALGSDSSALNGFLFPVIRISTDLKGQEHVYLLEDGLDLWLAMMEYVTDPPDEEFVSLVDHLIPLLALSTEHLKVCLSLVNFYCLIYPESFAERFGALVCTELNSTLTDMRAEGVAMVLRSIENLLRTSPTHGPIAMEPILGKIFRSAHDDLDTPMLMSLFLSIVGRLVLISEQVAARGIEMVSKAEGKSPSEVLGTLIDVMSNKNGNVVQSERKKLISIALLKLMSTGDPVVLHRICGIFLAVSETLNDILKVDSNGKSVDSLFITDFESARQGSQDGQETVTESDLRKKRLASNDMVYTVDLVQLFRNEVNNLRAKLGEAHFADAISTIDVETLELAKPFLE